MTKNSKTTLQPFGLAGRQTKQLKAVSPNGRFMNLAVINQSEGNFSGGGSRDFLNENSSPVDENTMFGEGSIGKIRFAGLAYMLQQEGLIDLQQNAGEFFRGPKFLEFLQAKYPKTEEEQKAGESVAEELYSRINGFFAGDKNDQESSANATLADLFTHHAGVGDLTRAGVRAVEKEGVEHEFTLPELILGGINDNPDLLDETGKPRAHRPIDMPTPDHELPKSRHGNHEYSNLGYWLGALAMEAVDPKRRDYKQLMRDFMLQPIEGRLAEINQENEKEKLEFHHTKFPEDIHYGEDNVVTAHWLERDANGNQKISNANKCSAANAAGGMFASASDSAKFFEEFFRGFPGTADGANKFFSAKTIQAMEAEWMSYPPANGNPKKDGFLRFQAPGAAVDYPYDEKFYSNPFEFFAENQPFLYCKSGGTAGYDVWFELNPKSGKALISIAQNCDVGIEKCQENQAPKRKRENDENEEEPDKKHQVLGPFTEQVVKKEAESLSSIPRR